MAYDTKSLKTDANWLRVDEDINDPDHDRLHAIAARLEAAAREIELLEALVKYHRGSTPS